MRFRSFCQGWRGGDPAALDALVSLVYKELRRLAHFQFRDERQNHTLQSSALVARVVGFLSSQFSLS